MSDDERQPLVPSYVDLSGYGWMPFYGHRLFGSDFNAKCSDAEWRAGVTLWWRAWNQVPAASLPDDDAALARLADLGRDVKTWKRLRDNALRGFVKCSDGRLYHKVMAELVLEAWDRRVSERERKNRWRAGQDRSKNAELFGTERGQDGDATVTSQATGPDRTIPDKTIPPFAPPFEKSNRGRRRLPSTSVPDEFPVSKEMVEWAIGVGVPSKSVEDETRLFLDKHRSLGSLFSDWNAAWRTWMRRVVKFAQERR
jgi:hypothetical protein